MKVRIRAEGKMQEVEVTPRPQETLLESLEAQRVRLPYGCRSGSCGSCLVKVVVGAECLQKADAIEADTLSRCEDAEEGRLACRAHWEVAQCKETSLLEIATPEREAADTPY